MVTPASRQMLTRLVAPAASLEPQALKNSLPPPNVAVPMVRAGTVNPEPPSCLNSIVRTPDLEFALRMVDARQGRCASRTSIFPHPLPARQGAFAGWEPSAK